MCVCVCVCATGEERERWWVRGRGREGGSDGELVTSIHFLTVLSTARQAPGTSWRLTVLRRFTNPNTRCRETFKREREGTAVEWLITRAVNVPTCLCFLIILSIHPRASTTSSLEDTETHTHTHTHIHFTSTQAATLCMPTCMNLCLAAVRLRTVEHRTAWDQCLEPLLCGYIQYSNKSINVGITLNA